MSESLEPEKSPIFVLGAPRSGTSAVSIGLQRAELRGYPEGHIFPLLRILMDAVKHHYLSHESSFSSNIHLKVVPRDTVRGEIKQLFARLFLSEFGSSRWFDKTPGIAMLSAIPLLLEIWPDARFVFCKRRGIDCVMSQQRYFGDAINFETACATWTSCMMEWKRFRQRIPEDHRVEIDQVDMLRRPFQVAHAIGDATGLTRDQISILRRTFDESFMQATATTFDPISLFATPWNDMQRASFERICQPVMTIFGYSSDLGDSLAMRSRLLRPDGHYVVEVHNLIHPFETLQDDGSAFMLHPNYEASAPEVIFRDIDLDGVGHFQCMVGLLHPESGPVIFSIELAARSGQHVQRFEKKCGQFGRVFWAEQFAPLRGRYDVRLSTSMSSAAPNNHCAWATWYAPMLYAFDKDEAGSPATGFT